MLNCQSTVEGYERFKNMVAHKDKIQTKGQSSNINRKAFQLLKCLQVTKYIQKVKAQSECALNPMNPKHL